MAVNSGIISAPVSVSDVRSAIGESSTDVGTLCKSSKINKWSKWKPYQISGLESPTGEQVIMINMGINVNGAANAALKAAAGQRNAVNASEITSLTPDSVVMGEYAYIRPTGGTASPYRLTDFCADKDSLSTPFPRQYNHNSVAPDSWEDWELSDEQLQEYAGLYLVSSEITDRNTFNWVLNTSKTAVFQGCAIRVGAQSQETIGYTNTAAMPMTYLFGNGLVSDSWRLGLAIYLPYGSEDGITTPYWGVMCGSNVLKNGYSNNGVVLPKPSTNLRLMRDLWYHYNRKNISEFDIVPVIVKNCYINYTAGQSASQWITYLAFTDSSSAILTTPSKSKIKLKIVNTGMKCYDYTDSSYRGRYYSPIKGAHTFKICKGTVVSSGSTTTTTFNYYRITVPTGCVGTIANSGSNANGNLVFTVTSGSSSSCTVISYSTEADWRNNTNGTSSTVTFANIWQYFASWVGASAPASVTPYVNVGTV